MTGDAVTVGDTSVPPGERRQFRFRVGESFLGDPVGVPVTVINGAHDGPTVGLTAAIHGDELNGVKVCQEVAASYDPTEVHGAVVVLHVVNPPAFEAQQRYVPIYDLDLNRSFPGRSRSNTAERLADRVYRGAVAACDWVLDFHTSTRNRTTMFHARADMSDPEVARIARAFGTNVVLDGESDAGSLRAVATADGIPTVTVEMGKAHRFQRPLVDRAVAGVRSVFAEVGLLPGAPVDLPAWRTVVDAKSEKRWLRADDGGLVEMEWGPDPLVLEGDPICTVSDHFRDEMTVVRAPFTGLVVGVLESPLAAPGHPVCHLARLAPETRDLIRAELDRGEFDGYRAYGLRWLGDEEAAE